MNEYCPACKRWLARYELGEPCFDLAPKARLIVRVKGERDDPALFGLPVPLSAECMRWRCRLKRASPAGACRWLLEPLGVPRASVILGGVSLITYTIANLLHLLG